MVFFFLALFIIITKLKIERKEKEKEKEKGHSDVFSCIISIMETNNWICNIGYF